MKKVRSIALVGDLADEENIGDYGSSQVHPPYIVTLKQAIEENYPDAHMTYIPTSEVKDRHYIIEHADAVITVCGMRHSDEGEYIFIIGGDRKELGLKNRDVKMIKEVSSLNKNSIVVLIGGNMIRMNEWHDDVSSVLFAYYPGMEGGNALADIIFGKVNPGGKLPFVIGKSDEDFPQVKWHTLQQDYGYYHGYKKLLKDKKEEDYSYGFGLSYTDFEISEPVISVSDDTARFSVTVKNVGEREGSETVQLYMGYKNSAVERPERELYDFKRVYLDKGKSTEITLTVKKSELSYYGQDGFIEEDIDYIAYIGNSERNSREHAVVFRFGE